MLWDFSQFRDVAPKQLMELYLGLVDHLVHGDALLKRNKVSGACFGDMSVFSNAALDVLGKLAVHTSSDGVEAALGAVAKNVGQVTTEVVVIVGNRGEVAPRVKAVMEAGTWSTLLVVNGNGADAGRIRAKFTMNPPRVVLVSDLVPAVPVVAATMAPRTRRDDVSPSRASAAVVQHGPPAYQPQGQQQAPPPPPLQQPDVTVLPRRGSDVSPSKATAVAQRSLPVHQPAQRQPHPGSQWVSRPRNNEGPAPPPQRSDSVGRRNSSGVLPPTPVDQDVPALPREQGAQRWPWWAAVALAVVIVGCFLSRRDVDGSLRPVDQDQVQEQLAQIQSLHDQLQAKDERLKQLEATLLVEADQEHQDEIMKLKAAVAAAEDALQSSGTNLKYFGVFLAGFLFALALGLFLGSR